MHNHLTRNIMKYGECPGCDAYHEKTVVDIAKYRPAPKSNIGRNIYLLLTGFMLLFIVVFPILLLVAVV